MTKLQEAYYMTGGLSVTSKMPCYSWGIPTKYCRRGKELHLTDKDSICGRCYAMKGAYNFPSTKDALEYRYQSWFNLRRLKWVDYMVTILNSDRVKKKGHFRWFDSGDLQGLSMLEDIINICERTPNIKHWLATREYDVVYQAYLGEIPDNLVIRQSCDQIDKIDRDSMSIKDHISTVISNRYIKLAKKQFTCPSSLQDGKCLDCRACWNSKVKNVAYIAH